MGAPGGSPPASPHGCPLAMVTPLILTQLPTERAHAAPGQTTTSAGGTGAEDASAPVLCELVAQRKPRCPAARVGAGVDRTQVKAIIVSLAGCSAFALWVLLGFLKTR